MVQTQDPIRTSIILDNPDNSLKTTPKVRPCIEMVQVGVKVKVALILQYISNREIKLLNNRLLNIWLNLV
jgi:hypothetical protein